MDKNFFKKAIGSCTLVGSPFFTYSIISGDNNIINFISASDAILISGIVFADALDYVIDKKNQKIKTK